MKITRDHIVHYNIQISHFRHKFKANPVNEKVLKNAHLGVKKVPPKELTKPIGFDLEMNKRTEVWSSHEQDEEPEPFHARPFPAAILKGPTVSSGPINGTFLFFIQFLNT